MEDDDLAPDALALLVPYLGPLADDAPERVDDRNPRHPGQTFDYALRRPDGQRVAVEVTRAWDEPFLAVHDPWKALGERLERDVQRGLPNIEGRYVLNVDPASLVRAKDQNLDGLVSALEQCAKLGPSSRIVIDEGVTMSNHTMQNASDIRVYVTYSSAEFELGPGSQARFANALKRKDVTIAKAGAAGYETHLAVVHWALGSTQSWRQYLSANPPHASHPQHIWAIDLNVVPGTQGRAPAERLYP